MAPVWFSCYKTHIFPVALLVANPNRSLPNQPLTQGAPDQSCYVIPILHKDLYLYRGNGNSTPAMANTGKKRETVGRGKKVSSEVCKTASLRHRDRTAMPSRWPHHQPLRLPGCWHTRGERGVTLGRNMQHETIRRWVRQVNIKTHVQSSHAYAAKVLSMPRTPRPMQGQLGKLNSCFHLYTRRFKWNELKKW